MIKMTHNDDHKEKCYSHTVYIKECAPYDYDAVFSLNPFNIGGYGATKEEAIEDFINKFRYVMKQLKDFEATLFDTDTITDNIVEVDCLGNPLKDSF